VNNAELTWELKAALRDMRAATTRLNNLMHTDGDGLTMTDTYRLAKSLIAVIESFSDGEQDRNTP
jgi:hypothetical protein